MKWIWSPFLAVLGSGATGLSYNGKFEPIKYDYLINIMSMFFVVHRLNIVLIAKVDHLNEYDLSEIHSAVSAGEPLNREVIDIFNKQFNLKVRDGYGQTENTLLVGITKDMEA